jgi:hypothetical protein
MAKVYAPPKEVGNLPQIGYPFDPTAYEAACQAYRQAVIAWVKEKGSGSVRGSVIRFQVADGYAEYVVYSLKPVVLIHLPLGDAWQFRYAHLLTAAAVMEEVKRHQAFEKLWSAKKSIDTR